MVPQSLCVTEHRQWRTCADVRLAQSQQVLPKSRLSRGPFTLFSLTAVRRKPRATAMTAIHSLWRQSSDDGHASLAMSSVQARCASAVLVAIALALLCSCSLIFGDKTPPPAPPLPASLPVPAPPATTIEPRIVASSDINPGALKHPSPVVVRVYELKSAAVFDRAAFFALFDAEKETLGAELVAREEFVVQPGAIVYVPKRVPDGASTVLGVIAAFQSLNTATWRASVAIKPNVDNRYTIHLDGTSVTLVGQP